MRVLMIAPPGAGKGTQGALIAAHFGIPTSRPVSCCAIT
jgi:adenylate kinase